MDERVSIRFEQPDGEGGEHAPSSDPPGAGTAPPRVPDAGEAPAWAALAAGTAPVLLIGGFSVAAALQPHSYSAVRDTISSLAAQGSNDPWVMTAALTGVGVCYVLTAIGLRCARPLGRVALAGGGVATLLISTFRQPAHGYSLSHAVAVVVAGLCMCGWPLLAARRRHWAPLLTVGAGASAAAVIIGLTTWFALEQNHGAVGLAERCAAAAAALWLFPVVATTRRALAMRTVPGASDTETRYELTSLADQPRPGSPAPV